jgi:uncharacterized protein (DUF934 family)
MPKLIKNAEIIDDNWQVLDKDFAGELDQNAVFVPLSYLLASPSILDERDNVGVWLDSDQGPEPLEPYLDRLPAIAINFPKFVDGRGYSYARILRDRFNYQGEVRAIGDILHDQLFYLKRCGFDAFAVREDKDISIALNGLSDFSNSYQTATDQPLPLFRRRN